MEVSFFGGAVKAVPPSFDPVDQKDVVPHCGTLFR